MRRLFTGLVLIVALFALLLAVRAVVTTPPDYLQIQPLPVDSNSESMLDRAAQVLSGGVQIETVSYQQRESRQADALRQFQAYLVTSFPRLHEQLRLEVVNEFSLLYHWRGSNPALEPILLLGHYDTVPVAPGSEDRWTWPPFSGAIAEGYIWGRGTLDDKSMIVAQMSAIEQLLAEDYQPERSIYLAYGHDEEIGGTQGAKKISETLQQKGLRFALILDEGSVVAAPGMIPGIDRPVAMLGHAEKGYLSLRLIARDSGGHSAMPPKHTAAGRIAHAVTLLENTRFPASLDHSTDFFDNIMAFMPFTQRLLLANSWLFAPMLIAQMEQNPALNAALRTTTAVTMLAGSPKENVLPTEASAVINFRIMPGETIAGVIEHVRTTIDDASIHIEPVAEGLEPSPVSPPDEAGYALLERTARESWPDDTLLVTPRLVLVTTDTRHYHDLSGHVFRFMPVVLKLTDVASIHGSNERLSLDNLDYMLRFYRQLMLNASKPN